jgi:hypothetical protein
MQWHPTRNGDLTAADVGHKQEVLVAVRCGSRPASPHLRVGSKTGCPCCSGHKLSATNSLAILAPKVAAQWHPTKNGDVKATDVTSGANKKYKWEASPGSRIRSSTGCPCCSGNKVSVTNSLATLAPKVAAQWHPTGNGVVTPADIQSQTNKKYWWRCEAGPDHEWKASPASRVGRGSGCPSCTHRQL